MAVAVAVFIPVEETQAVAQMGVRDFFRAAWVENLRQAMRTEDLEVAVVVVVVVVQDRVVPVEVEVEEDTPGEAVEVKVVIPVEEGEDLLTKEKISITNAVTIQLVMVM